MWLLAKQTNSHPIGCPTCQNGCLTCTPKGTSMSPSMDLEGHRIYQNVWNGNPVKMVPLKSMSDQNKSMSDQKQGKSYHYWLPNIGHPINQLPNIISWPTCAIHQNNQLDECVKMSHRASSQHHQQLNKTPLHLKGADQRAVWWCFWRNWMLSW